MLKLHPKYLILALVLFVVEICIALFFHDNFIRPFVGDFLVVILIYCFVRSFFNLPTLKLAIGVLIFSFFIEILQYFKIVNVLGLQQSKIAKIVIGTSFEWTDLVAYTLGIGLVLLLDRNA